MCVPLSNRGFPLVSCPLDLRSPPKASAQPYFLATPPLYRCHPVFFRRDFKAQVLSYLEFYEVRFPLQSVKVSQLPCQEVGGFRLRDRRELSRPYPTRWF